MDRLRTWIESTGESPESLGVAAGLARASLRQCLDRGIDPSVATLRALAQTYGLSPTWIVTGQGKMIDKSLIE